MGMIGGVVMRVAYLRVIIKIMSMTVMEMHMVVVQCKRLRQLAGSMRKHLTDTRERDAENGYCDDHY